MKIELTKTFEFSAAHSLPATAEDHRCHAAHGHNYCVDVTLYGEVDPQHGWLMDFGDLKEIVAPVIKRLDHKMLNEIPGLENPTSENLSRWIWEQLAGPLPQLRSITIRETSTSQCTYRGET